MGEVYTNCFCCIAATASIDGSHGLYRARDLYMLRRLEIETAFSALDTAGQKQRYTMYNNEYWSVNLEDAPLNKRGWVVQERLLAPRIIHFTEREVMWECRQITASEVYPTGSRMPSIIGNSRVKDLNPYSPFNERWTGESAGAHLSKHFYPNVLWERVMRTYLQCSFTDSRDKAVALSGIAKHFQTITDDRYIAGMWERNLARELLWSVVDEHEEDIALSPTHLDEYRGPSWSPLSLDARSWPASSKNIDPLIHVDNIDISTVADDDTGPLSHASLHLSGLLRKPPNWPWAKRKYKTMWAVKNTQNYDELVFITLDNPAYDLVAINDSGRLFCMPAGITAPGFVRNSAKQSLVVLLELIDHTRRSYRRIAMLNMDIDQDLGVFIARQPGEEEYPCLRYDAEAERTHTILLV